MRQVVEWGEAILTTNARNDPRFEAQMSVVPADTLEGAEAAGRALLEMGAQAVIITLAAEGAMLVRPGECVHLKGIPIADAVDTTDAGDAFMGGLAVAIAEGKTIPEAIRFANISAALSTRRRGAMPSMPDRLEVDAFIQARQGTR